MRGLPAISANRASDKHSLKNEVVFASVVYSAYYFFNLILSAKPKPVSPVRFLVLDIEHFILENDVSKGALNVFYAFVIKITSVFLVIDY